MSGAEVGTAYVRIRPQMSSFRAETQSGVRSAFSTVGKILLPTVAFAGITEGVRKSVRAAELKQVVTGQLQQAFRQVGLSFAENAPQVEAAIRNQQRLGFEFDESAQAMTRSVRATGNVATALKLQNAAADLARGQNISLTQATQILIRAYNGQSAGLKRLGVTVEKHSKGLAVLDAVQTKFAGSAEKFSTSAAGSQQRLTAAVTETEALIGGAFIPTVTRLNTRLASWLENTENQKKIQDAVNGAVRVGGQIVHDLGIAFSVVAPPLKEIVHLLGGFGHVVESALVIGLLVKAKRATAGLFGITKAGEAMGASVVKGSATATDAVTKLGVAADRTAAQIVADAAKERAAYTTLAAPGFIARGPVPDVTRTPPPSIAAVTAAAAGANLIEASKLDTLDTALKDVAASSDDLVQSATLDTANLARDKVATIQKVGTGAVTALGTVATKAGVQVEGTAMKVNALTAAEEKAAAAASSLGPAAAEGAAVAQAAAAKTARSYGALTAIIAGAGAGLGRGVAAVGGRTAATKIAEAGGLKLIAGKMLGRGFGIALDAYIADAILASLTGFDPIASIKKGLTQSEAIQKQFASQDTFSGKGLGFALTHPTADIEKTVADLVTIFKGPKSPGAILSASGKEMRAALKDIPALQLARDEAALTAETARTALSQEKAAHSSIAYREKQQALSIALEDVAAKQRALDAAERRRQTSIADQAEALSRLGVQTKASGDGVYHYGTQVKFAGDASRGFSTATKSGLGPLALFASATDKATTSGAQWAKSIRAASDANGALTPLQRHNNELIAEFAERIKGIPTLTEIKVILNNRDALIGLDRLLAKIKENIFAAQDLGGALTTSGKAAANAANEAVAGFSKRAPNALLHPFGATTELRIRLADTAGQTGKARLAALRDEVAAEDRRATFALSQARNSTGATRKKWLAAFDTARGAQTSAQSEIDADNAAAASKAKTARDAAAAKAKAAREKAAQAYQSGIADQESSLRRAATKAKAAALRAISLGREVAGERRKLFALPGANEGLLERGNIDLLHRKVAHLANGSIATVHSFSVSTDRGEVLLSQVLNGRLVSTKKAIEHYRKTGENLGIFKTIKDADAYAERLHKEQAALYTTAGKTASPPPAGLAAALKAADNAEIAFYRTHGDDSRLTAAQRRSYKDGLQKALAQRTSDLADIKAAVQKRKDDVIDLALSLAQLAVKTGTGSQARVDRLQTQADDRQKALLRQQVARFTKRANDASLGAATQAAAAKKANSAEDALLTLGATIAGRTEKRLSLAVQEADLAVSAAGTNATKLSAAYEQERKALKALIALDKRKAHDLGVSVDERTRYKSEQIANEKKLLELDGKSRASGFSLVELAQFGAAQFQAYGSNIAPRGTPLSPQDERAAFGKVLSQIAKKKAAPVVIQHFHNPQDPYAATRAAQLAAEHQYIGGV